MSLAGSSSFFKGSVVTYSDESKIEILKIEKEKNTETFSCQSANLRFNGK